MLVGAVIKKNIWEYKKHLDNSIDLANAIGVNWEEFSSKLSACENGKFQISSQWSDGYFIKDKQGTSVSVREDGNVYSAYITEYKTNYCIKNVFIGQDYRLAKYLLKTENMKILSEYKNKLGCDTYSDWSDGRITIFIEEKENKVTRVGVYLE